MRAKSGSVKLYFLVASHRAFAAFLAIAFRLAGVSDAALALPPFNPPMRPRATAAGFFSGCGDSFARLSMLERLGMGRILAYPATKLQLKFWLDPYVIVRPSIDSASY